MEKKKYLILLELIKDFVSGKIIEYQFESLYLKFFLSDIKIPPDLYHIFNEVFYDVEEYCVEPFLRYPGEVDDEGLLQSAKAALKKLKELECKDIDRDNIYIDKYYLAINKIREESRKECKNIKTGKIPEVNKIYELLESDYKNYPQIKADNLSESQVLLMEKEIGFKIDKRLKYFLQNHFCYGIGRFNIFAINKPWSLLESHNYFRKIKKWPNIENWLIFSMDSCANPIGILPNEEIWVSNKELKFSQYKLANNFEEFIYKALVEDIDKKQDWAYILDHHIRYSLKL